MEEQIGHLQTLPVNLSQQDAGEEVIQVGIAGRTALYAENWYTLTTSSFVRSMIMGVTITFSEVPNMFTLPRDFLMSDDDKELVDVEIQSMLNKGAIIKVHPVQNQFVSNIFLRPKKSGGLRPIINLKKLNQFITVDHFKMENLPVLLPLVKKGCFMTSLDLRDAYYTLPVHEDFRKYLRFTWRSQLFEFTCLCFGLSPAPYIFTKVMKPVFSELRRKGIKCTYYIDDSLYFGSTLALAEHNTKHAKTLLESLGFVVNTEKSVMKPSTRIQHLGFIIDSVEMKVFLPEEKLHRIISACAEISVLTEVTVRRLAQVIGLIVSSFMAVRHGQLHYRQLEVFKSRCLEQESNYDKVVTLPNYARQELTWWCENIECNNGRDISQILGTEDCDVELFTDASNTGWGALAALVVSGTVMSKVAGHWSFSECSFHINWKELKAVQLGLHSFAAQLADAAPGWIKVNSDNTTAIAYINHYGGCHSALLDSLSREIWDWCISKNISLKAVHIPGLDNTMADKLSRELSENIEWSLSQLIFDRLCQTLGSPGIDLFASRLN